MIRIGVIGTGHLGKIHLNLLKEIPSFSIAGFYDTDPNVSEEVVAKFQIKNFSSAEELVDSCDAIDVVTPTVFHHQYGKQILNKKKHLFIEKPLASSADEALELSGLSKQSKVKLQVGHVERFNPAFSAAKKFIESPMFIESHRLAEFNPRGTDVSVIHDLMIHDIDIILSTVKSEIKNISASGVAVISDTPDIANARIEFENGCVANITSSRISMKNMRKTRFFQHNAYISVDFLKKKTEVVRLKELKGDADPLAVVIDLGKGKGQKQIYYDNPKIEETNAIKTELEMFADAIISNTETQVTGYDGYKAVDVANRIAEMIRKAPALV